MSEPIDQEPGRPARQPGQDQAEVSQPGLADVLHVLRAERKLVLACVAAAVALAAAWLLYVEPTYRSDVLIQVEEKDRGLAGLGDFSNMFSEKTPAEAEMEILRSRSLVGAVVDGQGLDIVAYPRYAPVVGAPVARRWREPGLRPPWFGLSGYAWGGERILLDRLEVPAGKVNQPYALVAGEGGAYRLLAPSGAEVLQGKAGVAASGGGVELFVSELAARPGTRFVVQKRRRADTVADLQAGLLISEKGRRTGIIVVAMTGPDPARLARILDSLAQTYQRQNVERRSAEAEKTLQFVESQLPILKKRLDEAEDAVNALRSRKGSVDLSLETKGVLEKLAGEEKQLTELSLQQSELRQRFTESHPALLGLGQKREKLLAEKAATEARLRNVPETELESARLMREVKTNGELYLLLVNRAQELRVVKSGTVGNVRLIDAAVVPYLPVAPSKGATLFMALTAGLLAGVALAFVRRALGTGVDDPEAVERATGVSVYVTVPHSDRQDALLRRSKRDHSAGRPILAVSDPDDLAVESLRSLRTALLFSLLEAESKVVGIVGAAPSAGKSFVAVNLATVLADSGKRVLLIDADLRKGRLHSYFGVEREGGLSELISGTLQPPQGILHSGNPGVDFITTGALPANPSEMLGSQRFRSLVEGLSPQYDLVLIDTAPILAVSDGVTVGRLAGVNLLVLRAGAHPIREISLAVKRFRQNGVDLHGAVMNDVKATSGAYGRYSYHYQYDYRAEK